MSDYMDGNMLGGTLGELFSMDVTSAMLTCVSCGASWAVAIRPPAPTSTNIAYITQKMGDANTSNGA